MKWLREYIPCLLAGILTGAGCLAACLFLTALTAFWLFGVRLPAPISTPGHTVTRPRAHTSTPPRPLTPTPATPQPIPHTQQPTGHIVFTCFNTYDNICRINADGSDLRRLTVAPATDFYPEISSLGNLITFSSRRSGEFRIYLMDLDGDNLTQVGPDAGSHFAPDLFIMRPDGSDIRRLTTNPRPDWQPRWGP